MAGNPSRFFDIFFDRRGEIALDNIEDLQKAFPKHANRATKSALSSEGFRLMHLIRNWIKGSYGWKPLNPHTGVLSRRRSRAGHTQTVKNYRMGWKGPKGAKKRVRQYKQFMGSTRTRPLLKLAGAVRYNYDPSLFMVNIGFIRTSTRLLQIVHAHAEGYTTRVTPKMRKMMFALGFPLKKSTTELKTPARPVIEPVFDQEKDRIHENVKTKYLQAVTRYILGDAAKRP